MSIPKTLHYCWFGGKPKPPSVRRCLASWRRFCPDYEIIEWNEQRFDVNAALYTRQAYAAGRWAFVTDYARLKIVYEQGGIYLDTDVELLRPLDELLQYDAFFGFQQNGEVATGLGFGACKGHPALRALLEDYEGVPFLAADGTPNAMPCPTRNTKVLERLGVRADGKRQSVGGMEFFPPEYFCPIDYRTRRCTLTPNTYSIHHYDASWKRPMERFDERCVRPLLGPTLYEKLYRPARCALGQLRQNLFK